MVFRSFFTLYILIFSTYSAAYFPWLQSNNFTENDTFYHLKIDAQTTKFLNEGQLRYATGVELNIDQPFFETEASYTYNFTEKYHYFRPYELSLKLEAEKGQWILGRQKKNWDPMDHFWHRNLWQPVYNDDYLRPKAAGLVGLFRDFNYHKGQLNLFGSFIFIPEILPPSQTIAGKIISKNPWFVPPPSKIEIGSNILPNYQFQTPELKEFLKPSIGARASYDTFYIAYSYKPMNQIRVKTNPTIDLSKEPKGDPETGFLLDIPVESVILQHHLLSTGFTFQYPNYHNKQNINYLLNTSFTYNHPEKHTLKNKKWFFFQPLRECHLSVKGEIHIKDTLEETTLHLAYTHQFALEERKDIPLLKIFSGQTKQFFLDNLFQFSRAASTGITHSIRFNNDQLFEIKGRLIYHLLKEYFLFSFYGGYSYNQSVSLFVSGDILFSDFPFSIDQTKENIGIYANKSRIFGGVSYAF